VAKGSTQENLLSNARSFLGKFYSALFEPLEKELQGARYLRVVPHGLLHYLPFHALYKASEGKYLLELYEEISYAPAARLLERTRGEAQGRDALVFGYSGGGALPGTLEEAQSVYDILSNLGESRLAMEVEASLENFRKEAPSRRILHLAAHGSFREDAPLFSSVLLEGGELSAHELFNMELNASLLTLSCCESGLGAIGGGDEIMGLSRACLYAGVKSLVLSLWRVEDTASSRLMQDFYGELVKGQAKAAALCKAQLAMVHSVQYDHPYYWAPFVLIGDCGKI
jgi:CHAT domain-containing protein